MLLTPPVEHQRLIERIPLPKQRPCHIREHVSDLLL
jgi:hypothetical protein